MPLVEIVLGERWKDDVLHLGGLRSRRPSDAGPRLSEFRDVVDLVVHGENWTADIDEEHIFSLVSDLVSALESLVNGDSLKEIVEFPSTPYELTLVAQGEQLWLTLMSVDRSREVLAFDVAVPATDFVHAVCRAGEHMLADLFALDGLYAADPFARSFGAALAGLARRRKIVLGRGRESSPREIAGVTSQAGSDDFSLSYELTLTPAFLDYAGEPTFDWHSLLLPGQLVAESRGRQAALGGQFPILTMGALLRRVREMLGHEDAGRSSYACTGRLQGVVFEVEVVGGTAQAVMGQNHDITAELAVHGMLDGVLSLCRLVVDDLHRNNPAVAQNARFEDLTAELAELEAWFADTRRENEYLERPEAFLQTHAGLRPHEEEPVEATFGWPMRDVRAVYPSRRWTMSQPQIHFSGITAVDGIVLVPTGSDLRLLDAETGAVAWSRDAVQGVKLASYAYAGPWVVVANERGARAVLETTSGSLVCEREGGSPLLIGAAAYPSEGLVVVADYRGNLAGLSVDGAGPGWSSKTGQGALVDVVFAGPVVATLSAPGVVQAFEPTQGAQLWKVRLGGQPEAGPFSHEGRLYVVVSDGTLEQSVLACIHPFTGRTLWQVRLGGRLVSVPSFSQGRMVAVVEDGGQTKMVAFTLEAGEVNWSQEVSTAGLDRPTQPLFVDLDQVLHVVVRTDRGEMTCVEVASGELRWQVRPESSKEGLFVRNLPVFAVRDSLLCAGEKLDLYDVQTGEILHRFADVFEAPEFLHVASALQILVGEAGDVGGADQLTSFALEHFLAVVR